MQNYTDEKKKGLIERCNSLHKEANKNGDHDAQRIYEAALAALTAKPVEREEVDALMYWEKPLYTTPPVAVMVPVEKPGTKCIGWVKDAIKEHDEKWCAAIRSAGYEVATAPAEEEK